MRSEVAGQSYVMTFISICFLGGGQYSLHSFRRGSLDFSCVVYKDVMAVLNIPWDELKMKRSKRRSNNGIYLYRPSTAPKKTQKKFVAFSSVLSLQVFLEYFAIDQSAFSQCSTWEVQYKTKKPQHKSQMDSKLCWIGRYCTEHLMFTNYDNAFMKAALY